MPDSVSIFLLPGFDGTGKLFAPFQSAIGEKIKTVAISYKDEILFEDYVESVASLLPQQNIVLVAESFSGPIAIELMSRYPCRFKCSVLCATFATSPFRSLTRIAKFVPEFLFSPGPMQRAILQVLCFDKKTDPSLVTDALNVIRSVPASTIKSRLNALSNIDMQDKLARVSCPVLYLQALQDRIVGKSLSRKLVDGLPRVTVSALNGPHLLLQSRPNQCSEIIKSFIEINQ